MKREDALAIVERYKPIGTVELLDILEQLGLIVFDEPEDYRNGPHRKSNLPSSTGAKKGGEA
jgi:hypothetical protein